MDEHHGDSSTIRSNECMHRALKQPYSYSSLLSTTLLQSAVFVWRFYPSFGPSVLPLYKFMHVGICFTRDSFFFWRLICELAEPNSTKIGHMVGSKCNLKTHVRNLGYPFPLQIGGPKTTFLGRLRNSRTFNGLYLRNETWHRQSVKCVDNYRGSPTSSQNDMHFGPQTASNWKWVFTHPT